MGQPTANYWYHKAPYNCLFSNTHLCGNTFGMSPCPSTQNLSLRSNSAFGGRIVVFASRKSGKKLKKNRELQSEVKSETNKRVFDDYNGLKDNLPLKRDIITNDFETVNEINEVKLASNVVPSRNTVLQACTITSGLIAALGLVIRQVSQVASSGGFPFSDCSEVSFDFQVWHLELITGLVALISLSRFALLKAWPDFAESSETANRQVLTSLEGSDYLIVAFLPGISEELLFRGALLPLLGLNWISVVGVAALFGILHLGSGRKFSFAIWATFVGVAYGYATIVSSSLVVPMASHALNNLVGALIWRQSSKSPQKLSS